MDQCVLGFAWPRFVAAKRLVLVVAPCLIIASTFVAIPVARAEPITSIFLSWLAGHVLDDIWDKATGAPDVRQMRRELDELMRKDYKNADEIARLRSALRDGMSQAEVERVLMASLTRVDRTLAEHAQRLHALEEETTHLREANESLQRRITPLEQRVDRHEQKLFIHEWRLQEQERKFAQSGVSGIENYRAKQFALAVEEFDKGIAGDPGEPAFYYGKALALRNLGRPDEAVESVETGVSAQQARGVAKWFQRVMEKVQGPDRIWLQDTLLRERTKVIPN